MTKNRIYKEICHEDEKDFGANVCIEVLFFWVQNLAPKEENYIFFSCSYYRCYNLKMTREPILNSASWHRKEQNNEGNQNKQYVCNFKDFMNAYHDLIIEVVRMHEVCRMAVEEWRTE